MKNIKCIIGATLVVPVVAAIIIGAMFGGFWLMDNTIWFAYVVFIIAGILVVGFLFSVWMALYLYCTEHHKDK